MKIYRRGPLKWSEMLPVDRGKEFMAVVLKWKMTTRLFVADGLGLAVFILEDV